MTRFARGRWESTDQTGTSTDQIGTPNYEAAGSGRSGRKGGTSGGEVEQQEREQSPESLARAIVLRQLTNSPKSRKQLADKLAERDVPESVAQAVLDRFEEVQLIDDAEFAKMWVRSRSRAKSLAKGALRRELAERGISEEDASGALAQLSDDAELVAAQQLVRKKLPANLPAEDRAAREKICRRLVSMLARKGYSPGLAFSVVNQELDLH